MARLHAIVKGKVQGVNYRAFAQQAATKLLLKGYVKNKKDKSVEVVAEGSQLVLMGFIEALKKGPPGSEVKCVDVKYEKESSEFDGFEIR